MRSPSSVRKDKLKSHSSGSRKAGHGGMDKVQLDISVDLEGSESLDLVPPCLDGVAPTPSQQQSFFEAKVLRMGWAYASAEAIMKNCSGDENFKLTRPIDSHHLSSEGHGRSVSSAMGA